MPSLPASTVLLPAFFHPCSADRSRSRSMPSPISAMRCRSQGRPPGDTLSATSRSSSGARTPQASGCRLRAHAGRNQTCDRLEFCLGNGAERDTASPAPAPCAENRRTGRPARSALLSRLATRATLRSRGFRSRWDDYAAGENIDPRARLEKPHQIATAATNTPRCITSTQAQGSSSGAGLCGVPLARRALSFNGSPRVSISRPYGVGMLPLLRATRSTRGQRCWNGEIAGRRDIGALRGGWRPERTAHPRIPMRIPPSNMPRA